MEYNKWVADLEVGDEIEGFYILKTAQIKTSNSGKPFLAAVVADRSGAVDAKCWDYAGPLGVQDEGTVIKIRGSVTEYRGALQVILSRLRPAQDGDQYNLGELVPVAPIDVDAGWKELLDMADGLGDGDYRAVCRKVLERYGERFRSIPGGKSMHHSFVSGLLMHTLYMARIADQLAGVYPEVIDRDLLVAGTILHDVAKCDEFVTSPLGLVTEYSTRGQLLGHLVMGAQAAAEAAKELGVPEEKSVLLQHMLLSHHGDPEFGAAVRPMCAEAELLSMIDLIDSRMEIYKETMEETEPGTFSKRVFALDKKIYRHK
ncbi:MAG: HD domain-containing protein [Oscillibacter sp.]|nr:HD domain-containing protein [Oscillibacter sp.]